MEMRFVRNYDEVQSFGCEQRIVCKEVKELKLYSLNVAGWCWKLTGVDWKVRFDQLCSYIEKKIREDSATTLAIGLQEVQLTRGKHLNILKKYFPDYHIILPKGYNPDTSPKSVISILLINKNLCDSISVNTLEGLEGNLRYNHVIVNLYNSYCFRLLNVNIPQTCFNNNTSASNKAIRINMRKLYKQNLNLLAKAHKKEVDVKLVVMGDMNETPDAEFMQNLVYTNYKPCLFDAIEDENAYTWENKLVGAKSRLDYILYSYGMLNGSGVSVKYTLIDRNTIKNELSDHALLCGTMLIAM